MTVGGSQKNRALAGIAADARGPGGPFLSLDVQVFSCFKPPKLA
jgi:hypothetical protein